MGRDRRVGTTPRQPGKDPHWRSTATALPFVWLPEPGATAAAGIGVERESIHAAGRQPRPDDRCGRLLGAAVGGALGAAAAVLLASVASGDVDQARTMVRGAQIGAAVA